MENEDKQKLFVKAMREWSNVNDPDAADINGYIERVKTTAEIVEEVAGILPFTEEDVANYLQEEGYTLSNRTTDDGCIIGWRVWNKELDE